MPRGDRTGPMGAGSGTGRGAGFCAGFDMPGFANSGPLGGMGTGRMRGGRAGWRNRFYATGVPGRFYFGGYPATPQATPPEMEKEILQNQVRALQAELETLNNRLSEMA